MFAKLGPIALQSALEGMNTCVFVHGAKVCVCFNGVCVSVCVCVCDTHTP